MAAPASDGRNVASPVGYYTYVVPDDVWLWSDGIYELHGYAPQTVPPTTERLLRHKHPDDRAMAYEVLETAVLDGRPFSCCHRIIDSNRRVRSVLSVGRGVRGDDGKVERLVGFLVDLTEASRTDGEVATLETLSRVRQRV